jgi:hypothetical protein
MKYKYVYLAIIIMTILHMYHVHIGPVPKRIVPVLNATFYIPSSFQNVTITSYNAYKHYSYHKQTLSLFYMKRRRQRQEQHHIR